MGVDALDMNVRTDFDCLNRLEVKINSWAICALAADIIRKSWNVARHAGMENPVTKHNFLLKIRTRCVQLFCEKYGTVSRVVTGKLHLRSAEKEFDIIGKTSHIAPICRGFYSGQLREDNEEYADEKHIIIGMDSERTLAFEGSIEVNRVDDDFRGPKKNDCSSFCWQNLKI